MRDKATLKWGHPEVGAGKFCKHDTVKKMTSEDFYIDNYWQK